MSFSYASDSDNAGSDDKKKEIKLWSIMTGHKATVLILIPYIEPTHCTKVLKRPYSLTYCLLCSWLYELVIQTRWTNRL